MKATLTALSLSLLILFAGAAAAQTPDGETPAEELLCDKENGAAFGLCNAYWEAMDCHLADDGDPLTEPAASEQACTKVGSKFKNITGRDVPCQAAVECSCFKPANWSDADLGSIWAYFASAGQESADTTYSDDGTLQKLVESPDDFSVLGAAVDGSTLECQVFSGTDSSPILTKSITPDEVGVCRELLATAAGVN